MIIIYILLSILIVLNILFYIYLNNKINKKVDKLSNISLKVKDVKITKTDDKNYISVKDYNAVGDGIADDTKAIQLAHNTLSENGGGTLYFPNGKYMITDTINIYTENVIKVLGNVSSVIFINSSVPKNVFNIGSKTAVSNNIIFENIKVGGSIGSGANKNGNTAFNVINRIIPIFNRCQVTNNYIGLYLETSYAPTITGCFFQNCLGSGIFVTDNSVNGMVVRDCNIYACGSKESEGAGIALNVNPNVLGEAVLIQGCKIESNYTGILAGNITSLNISNNYIEESQIANIFFNRVNHSVNISSNWLGTYQAGGSPQTFTISNVDGLTFIGNTLYDSKLVWGNNVNKDNIFVTNNFKYGNSSISQL